MRIDVFFDAFPHPAKPNLETQLLEWRRQGHNLRIVSLGRIGSATSAFPVRIVYTLRQRPVRLALKMLVRALRHPARTRRILRDGFPFKLKLKQLATDAQLFPDPPEAHFIHNLAAAVRFSYLKYALPTLPLAIAYHGGELPGVPQISSAEARTALQQADLVFSNTQASIAEVVSRGADPQRAFRAPTAFPIDRFPFSAQRAYLPGKRYRFVCVGRMAPEKGFDVALEAFAGLRRFITNFEVTLIGDGPEFAPLNALADELKMREFVRFTGHVDSAVLIPMLGEFDVFVLSSRPIAGSNWVETQAAVMQEAMLMGAVVVASDIGGVRESLPPSLHPYLYPPGSVRELLERLLAVTALDATALRELGHASRCFTTENFDITRVNSALLDRLATLCR